MTLGSEISQSLIQTVLVLAAATIGLILIALLIAYLPTMYAAFARREILVNLLEVRAGDPPSAVELLLRFHRIHGLSQLTEQWTAWENWFSDIEECHEVSASAATRVWARALKRVYIVSLLASLGCA